MAPNALLLQLLLVMLRLMRLVLMLLRWRWWGRQGGCVHQHGLGRLLRRAATRTLRPGLLLGILLVVWERQEILHAIALCRGGK